MFKSRVADGLLQRTPSLHTCIKVTKFSRYVLCNHSPRSSLPCSSPSLPSISKPTSSSCPDIELASESSCNLPRNFWILGSQFSATKAFHCSCSGFFMKGVPSQYGRTSFIRPTIFFSIMARLQPRSWISFWPPFNSLRAYCKALLCSMSSPSNATLSSFHLFNCLRAIRTCCSLVWKGICGGVGGLEGPESLDDPVV